MKKRKIGILTQPLMTNYGGILQNYALQKVLNDMGHDVETINYKYSTAETKFQKIILCLRLFISKYLLKRYKGVFPLYFLSNNQKNIMLANINKFLETKIKRTNRSFVKITRSLSDNFIYDVYIVGSDQVWRPCYSPFLPNFFLDFLNEEDSSVKIAYAASFGVDNWEFSLNETKIAKRNICKFNLVTVREDSAVLMCQKYLNTVAERVLDPTMLLNKEDYIQLFRLSETAPSQGNLMAYILDYSSEKLKIVDWVSTELHLKSFNVMPKKMFVGVKPSNINEYVFPSVEQWIRGFFDAEFIITDSFHGTVFSIIFRKPFIAIGNKGRGLSRFSSLLKLFNLENRLIYTADDLDVSLLNNVDYSNVENNLLKEQLRSIQILKSSIE